MTVTNGATKDLIGGSAALHRYVLHAPPSLNPRLNTNVLAFIAGLWILSTAVGGAGLVSLPAAAGAVLLLVALFLLLLRPWAAVLFPGAVAACLAVAMTAPAVRAPLTGAALVVWLAAWLYGYRTLSHYQRAARERIAALSGRRDVDAVLETGVLLHRVLSDKAGAARALASALALPGGDARLLYLAGLAMLAARHREEAGRFFARAAAATTDARLAQRGAAYARLLAPAPGTPGKGGSQGPPHP
jgi:hypothetical protein